jgi:hypothetical protein
MYISIDTNIIFDFKELNCLSLLFSLGNIYLGDLIADSEMFKNESILTELKNNGLNIVQISDDVFEKSFKTGT